MTDEVIDVRRAARYRLLSRVEGSFSGVEVSLINLSLAGAQISHGQPLRIGTRAKLVFRFAETAVSVQAQVVWSQVRQSERGLVYTSGLLLSADVPHATALHSMIRSETAVQDSESMEKKRERDRERQLRRQSGPKMQPPPANT